MSRVPLFYKPFFLIFSFLMSSFNSIHGYLSMHDAGLENQRCLNGQTFFSFSVPLGSVLNRGVRCAPFPLWLQTMLVLLSLLFFMPSRVTNALRVIGGNVTGFYGDAVILPCKLIESTESLSQISWQRKTRGKPVIDNFYTILQSGPQFVNGNDKRFKFIGNFQDNNGSLQLSDATLLDEGIYSCIFTLFPSGNHKTDIPLNILVPPVISVKVNPVLSGDEEVSLASCTAAGSKPPSAVKCVSDSNKVKVITNSTQHDNDTVTTVIWLFGVPTRELNQLPVNCTITSASLPQEKNLQIKLEVYFSPTAVKIQDRTQNSFECLTEANPSANFTWSRPNQPWPSSGVTIEGATLTLSSISSELNGLYRCEASNEYGKSQGHVYVQVTTGTCTACWVLFTLLLLLLLVAGVFAAWWYKNKRDLSQQAVPTRDDESGL